MKRRKIVLFEFTLTCLCSFFLCTPSKAQEKNKQENKRNQGTLIHPKCLFFLDKEKIPASDAFTKQKKREAVLKAAKGSPREAILLGGEKARYGIFIFESIKTESTK